MKLLNKVITYKESILAKFPIILSIVKDQEIAVDLLYKKVKSKVDDIGEFMEIMDCLYALGKIELDVKKGVIRYVA